jgi:hypothetical protein
MLRRSVPLAPLVRMVSINVIQNKGRPYIRPLPSPGSAAFLRLELEGCKEWTTTFNSKRVFEVG